jgi:hypothetical protein
MRLQDAIQVVSSIEIPLPIAAGTFEAEYEDDDGRLAA